MAEPAEAWDPAWPARRPELNEAWVVVNARSRHGRRDFDAAQEELSAQGVCIHAARRVSRPHEMEGALGQALAGGARWVIIGGGDGTVLAAANLLAGRDVTVGVLPLGTGNDFARSLGMPLDLPGACRALAERRVANVDLGCIGGRYFLNTVSIGFTAHAARSILPGAKRWIGRWAYLLAAARAFAGARPFRTRIRLDDREEEFEALELIVGNGRFHAGGTLLAPDASLEAGDLVFYAYAGLTRWQMLKMAMLAYAGRHVYHRQSHFAHARCVHVQTDPPQPMLVDGERRGHTPAEVRVAHAALRVVVGEGFERGVRHPAGP